MGALVHPDALAAALKLGDVLVLDVQFELGGPRSDQLYAAGHLPGAAHLPLEWALAGAPGKGGRHPLPDPQVLQEALRRCGVDDGDAVVVYDQQSSMAAGRAWWILRWAGLGHVAVLNGGLAAWRAAGHEVSTEPAEVAAGTVRVHPGHLPVLDADEAAQWAVDGRLIDVRTAERFRGDVEPIDPVSGHIPGALNLPMALLQHSDGTFRTAAQIRAELAAIGIDPSAMVGTSCGSGVTATQMTLALHQANIESVPYIGSWSEWITDPSRPVATG